MRKFNSTIVQKTCKCSEDCEKYPTLGYKGYYIYHFPGDIKKQKQNNKAVLSRLSRQLHKVQKLVNDAVKDKSKSDYLKIADILFSNYIKRRDSGTSKTISCICCNRGYTLKDKDTSGNYIVQALHFVPRGIYSLRFDERNVHAGCSYCNLMMHLEPNGVAYKNYRNYLVNCLGEEEVVKMESEKKKVGKITEADIKSVIEKYKSLTPKK
jgi:hypothetical protein